MYLVLLEVVWEWMWFILMIIIVMVIGMILIVMVSGLGVEWKNGLVWVLIGGLISFMFFIIIVVFMIYYVVDCLQDKLWCNK